METSVSKIGAALAAAKAEMGALVRDANNPHFKSKYATLANCIDVAEPALAKHGIVMVERIFREGEDMVLRLEFLHHESGETVGSEYTLRVKDRDNPQHMGSAITYARRYLITTMSGLAPEDDDGNVASHGHERSQPQRQPTKQGLPMDQWEAKCRKLIENPPSDKRAELTAIWRDKSTTWQDKHAIIVKVLNPAEAASDAAQEG